MKNYYSILGVSKNATADEIKRAFRQLAKKYHPDVNIKQPGNDILFKEIQEAYAVLSNAEKKMFYDQKLHFLKNKSNATNLPIAFHYSHSGMFSYRKKKEEVNVVNPLTNLVLKHWRRIPWQGIYLTAFVVGWLFCFIALYFNNYYLREKLIYEDSEEIIQQFSFIEAAFLSVCYGLGVMLASVFLFAPIVFVSLYMHSFFKLYRKQSK